jgi:hypothetical protein
MSWLTGQGLAGQPVLTKPLVENPLDVTPSAVTLSMLMSVASQPSAGPAEFEVQYGATGVVGKWLPAPKQDLAFREEPSEAQVVIPLPTDVVAAAKWRVTVQIGGGMKKYVVRARGRYGTSAWSKWTVKSDAIEAPAQPEQPVETSQEAGGVDPRGPLADSVQTPTASTATDLPAAYRVAADAVLRQGAEMDSAVEREAKKGDVVSVIEIQEVDGRVRMRLATGGWMSQTASDGTVLLERAVGEKTKAPSSQGRIWDVAKQMGQQITQVTDAVSLTPLREGMLGPAAPGEIVAVFQEAGPLGIEFEFDGMYIKSVQPNCQADRLGTLRHGLVMNSIDRRDTKTMQSVEHVQQALKKRPVRLVFIEPETAAPSAKVQDIEPEIDLRPASDRRLRTKRRRVLNESEGTGGDGPESFKNSKFKDPHTGRVRKWGTGQICTSCAAPVSYRIIAEEKRVEPKVPIGSKGVRGGASPRASRQFPFQAQPQHANADASAQRSGMPKFVQFADSPKEAAAMRAWLAELPEVDMTLPQPVGVRPGAVQFSMTAEAEKFAHRALVQTLQKAIRANSELSFRRYQSLPAMLPSSLRSEEDLRPASAKSSFETDSAGSQTGSAAGEAELANPHSRSVTDDGPATLDSAAIEEGIPPETEARLDKSANDQTIAASADEGDLNQPEPSTELSSSAPAPAAAAPAATAAVADDARPELLQAQLEFTQMLDAFSTQRPPSDDVIAELLEAEPVVAQPETQREEVLSIDEISQAHGTVAAAENPRADQDTHPEPEPAPPPAPDPEPELEPESVPQPEIDQWLGVSFEPAPNRRSTRLDDFDLADWLLNEASSKAGVDGSVGDQSSALEGKPIDSTAIIAKDGMADPSFGSDDTDGALGDPAELSSFVDTMLMDELDAITVSGDNEHGRAGRDGMAVLDELLVEPSSLDQPLDLSRIRDSANCDGLLAMSEPEPEAEHDLLSQTTSVAMEDVGNMRSSALLKEAAAMTAAESEPTTAMILEWLPQPTIDMGTAPDGCASCHQSLKKKNKFVGRYCHYYGQHYCKVCHKGDKVIIPALLVKDWDRKKYEVCREARDFLRAHMDKPMIDTGEPWSLRSGGRRTAESARRADEVLDDEGRPHDANHQPVARPHMHALAHQHQSGCHVRCAWGDSNQFMWSSVA